MVPPQGVRFHEDDGEDREDQQGDDFLDHFELPDREGASQLGAADAVGRTWKQYSNRAIPQLSRMMDSIPKRSILDLKAICPYQANVIKVLERISRAMVARARLIIAEY